MFEHVTRDCPNRSRDCPDSLSLASTGSSTGLGGGRASKVGTPSSGMQFSLIYFSSVLTYCVIYPLGILVYCRGKRNHLFYRI